MRIGLNDGRKDRFLGLYECNQNQLNKKIRQRGTATVARSIDVCQPSYRQGSSLVLDSYPPRQN